MMVYEQDQLAAEYVLGILDAGERAKAADLIARDKKFAKAVEHWERRLAPLAEAIDPVQPPQSLKERLGLNTGSEVTKTGSTEKPARNQHHFPPAQRYRRLGFAGAAFLLLATASLTVFYAVQQSAIQGTQYIAMLIDPEQDKISYEATIQLDTQRLMVRSLGAEPPAGKSYELWLMYKDDRKPLTLGLVHRNPSEITILPIDLGPDDLSPPVTMAISLEPLGGAPIVQSMGPLVFAGPVEKK